MTTWSFSFDSLWTPGHLRRSANGPASISWHNLLRWLVSSAAVLFSNVHSKFTASVLGCSEETLFISFSKGVTGSLYCEIAHAWRETQKNVLVWSAILHVVELRVLVYSRVHLKFCQVRKRFCILAYFSWQGVEPALCQIMYSLSVCSDGTTSAAPRSFRQNRPPARTLSLT